MTKKTWTLLLSLILILSASAQNTWQALQPMKFKYLSSSVSGGYPAPSSIIINTPFDGVLTSTTGPTPTFTRSGLKTYNTSKTTVAEVATTVPSFGATVFGATSSLVSGINLQGETENLVLQSENFSTTWATVGTGASVSTDTATAPNGTVTADTVSGTATGAGVEQDTGISSTNSGWQFPTTAWIGSTYLKTSSGSGVVDVVLRDSAGTAQEGKTKCFVDTTWRRCEVYQTFTNTAAGTVVIGIYVGNSSNVRVWGAQLQRAGSTGGSNMRARADQGPYVATTTTTKFNNTETLVYPSATIDLARTTGSISMWFKPEHDGTSINDGNIISYLSVASEKLEIVENSSSLATFWINDSPTSHDSPGTADQGWGFRKGVWNHVLVTWNDTTNTRKLFVNGMLFQTNTDAFTTWAGGSDLYLGQHSGTPQYWSSRATYRNFVVWSTELTTAQAIAVYDLEEPTFTETYATGLLFDLDLGIKATPILANDYQYWYDGALIRSDYTGAGVARIPYFSNSTTYGGLVGHNKIPLPAYAPQNGAAPGMQFTGINGNYILQSNTPATTWTALNTAVVVNGVGNMFGANMPYGTIAGVSGDGIKQSNATYPVADKDFVVSAWVSTASGTLTGEIFCEGSSGGSPNPVSSSGNATFTATTTPQRVFEWCRFNGSSTGNIQLRLQISGTGTLNVSGLQVERRATANHYNIRAPGRSITTTTAIVQTLPNYLYYNTAGNINPKAGSMVFWFTLDMDSSTIADSDGPNLISIVGDSCAFSFHFVSDNLNFCMGGTNAVTKAAHGFLANVWYQAGATWNCGADTDKDGDVDCALELFIDGNSEDTGTVSDMTLGAWGRLVLGAGLPGQLGTDHHKGLIGKVRFWGDANSSYITGDWTTNRAGYGR